jgi:hypothetical protein
MSAAAEAALAMSICLAATAGLMGYSSDQAIGEPLEGRV